MARLKCLSLFSRVILDQAGADLYGFEVGDALILSDVEKVIAETGLAVQRMRYDQAAFLGDRPSKKIMACRIVGPLASLQIIAAEPGVLALVKDMRVLRTEILDFIEAAGISKTKARQLFDNDGDVLHERVRSWLVPNIGPELASM